MLVNTYFVSKCHASPSINSFYKELALIFFLENNLYKFIFQKQKIDKLVHLKHLKCINEINFQCLITWVLFMLN